MNRLQPLVGFTDEDHERQLLDKLPVTEIAGIAAGRAARLEPYGVKTCLDFARLPELTARKVLTASGHDLWLELNGVPANPIRTKRTPHRTIARGGSLAGRVRCPWTLYGWLTRNVERLVEELEYHDVRPARLTVFVSYTDAPSAAGVVNLNVPSDRFGVLMDAAELGLARAWRKATATHLHLIASDLRWKGAGEQQSLFDPPDPRADALAKVKREVNRACGRFKLRSGATLWANSFYQDRANEYDVCDIRGKFFF